MALSTTTYALSKKYTDKSIEGLGAIKGAPCTIKSTTETSEGTEVVFEWTGTDGTTETKTITIKNGVSITDIEINSNKHLICTMSDGSTIDAGEVPNVKGDTGFSPTIEENPNNTDEIYKLDITNESGTFTTPNLKGTAGGLDPDRYYDKTQVDALIEPLNEAKHTHENKENVLDKLTTNATGDILLFNGQKIKGSVEIDDTTTTAEDKAWSAKKTNDTIDKVKTWVNSEESLAIKTALYNNNTLTFYKKPNATVDDIADFSINLPEEQFLDQTKTTFINNFVWSEELYPNSTNPNLDNQPVLVLAVKGDTDVVYSFVSMNELVKIYKASTTVSTVTLTIDDATNTISAEVNISADEGNLLKIGTDGGLYAKAAVDNALSDTSENPVQNKVINTALNSKANASDLSDHTNNADIHVTAEEKTSWNNKAELTDIPSSLPANGGNADTVDGLHASDIQIDSVSDTAESVTLDELQGGVPFSDITLSGDIIGQKITLTACGKNLLKYPYTNTTKTINGITFTDNGDGTVTANGTATGNADFYISVNLRLNSGKYVLSGCPEGGSNAGYKLQAYGDTIFNTGFGIIDIGNNAPFEALEAFSITRLMIRFMAGPTADGLVFKPQLEIGGAATEYEPYSGSTIAITPDSNPYTVPNDIRQQEGINNVSVSAGEVKVTGVRRSAALGKIWNKLDELTAALIVANGEV